MRKNYFKLILAMMVVVFCSSALPLLAAEEGRWVRTNPSYHKFTLTKGKGVEICEAYLQRLNETWFERLPFCDRPENTDVPGFEKLNRVELTPEEIYPIYYRIRGFMDGDQYYYDKKEVMFPQNRDREIGYIKQNIGNRDLSAYRYKTPIDFDNNELTDNLIIWKWQRCGSYYRKYLFPSRGSAVVLVLTPESKAVDEAKTKTFICHPVGGYPESSGKSFYGKFRPVGRSMGIFRYKGKTYFDTFFDEWGDFVGKRKKSPDIDRTLGVFKRENNQTKQVCEYLWEIPYGAPFEKSNEEFEVN